MGGGQSQLMEFSLLSVCVCVWGGNDQRLLLLFALGEGGVVRFLQFFSSLSLPPLPSDLLGSGLLSGQGLRTGVPECSICC